MDQPNTARHVSPQKLTDPKISKYSRRSTEAWGLFFDLISQSVQTLPSRSEKRLLKANLSRIHATNEICIVVSIVEDCRMEYGAMHWG